MPQLSPQLSAKIASQPEKMYDVIVRVSGELDLRAAQLQADGFEIRRRFTLIRGFAATASGAAIQAASREEWIDSIEEDQPVTTMKST